MSRLMNLDIAIYVRKSRADVELEKESALRGEVYDTLTKHRKELLSFAKQYNHNIVDIFEEVVSGEFIAERPDMQQLLSNTRNLKYDGVLVMDIDRLGRGDKIDQGRIEKAFKDSQTLIITPSEVFDLNEESGEFNVEVRTFLSRFEYKKIKKRLQDGRIRSAKDGKDIGQKPPYGYRKDDKKFLFIHEEEAKLVRLIYQWCLDGLGRVQVARKLTEMGIPSPSGNPIWNHVSVRNILSNPKYKGDQVYGRRRWVKQEDGSYVTKLLKDPSLYMAKENAHEAIIDPDIWQKAQIAIQNRIQAPLKNNTDIVNPFAGIIRCKKCGKAILANNPSGRPNKYLFCGTIGCRQKMIALSKMEEVVIHELEEILKGLRAKTKHRDRKEEIKSVVDLQMKRVEKLKEEMGKVLRQKDNLHDLLEDGTYDKDTFLDRNRKLQDKLKDLEDELKKVESKVAAESSRQSQRDKVIPSITRALETYRTAKTVAEQNEALKTFIKTIRYNRDPDWNGPYQFEIEIEFYD